MSDLFYPLLIPALILTIYYYTFFSSEKVKNYNYAVYSMFMFHLIILYMWLFIEVKEILIGSPFDNPISVITAGIYYILQIYLTVMNPQD